MSFNKTEEFNLISLLKLRKKELYIEKFLKYIENNKLDIAIDFGEMVATMYLMAHVKDVERSQIQTDILKLGDKDWIFTAEILNNINKIIIRLN